MGGERAAADDGEHTGAAGGDEPAGKRAEAAGCADDWARIVRLDFGFRTVVLGACRSALLAVGNPAVAERLLAGEPPTLEREPASASLRRCHSPICWARLMISPIHILEVFGLRALACGGWR